MTIRGFVIAAALAPVLAGCATTQGRPVAVPPAVTTVEVVPQPVQPEWRGIATAPDVARIEALPNALRKARAAVPRRLAARLTAEGPLVDPDAAQPMPQLPPGSYYCRLVRFGGASHFRAFSPDFCYVDVAPNGMSFTKQTGTILPEGYIHEDTDKRLVFLGTSRTSDEAGGRTYGQDPVADQVGIVERVAPFRWRLVLGRAARGATLDMYELVPVPANVPGAKPATQPD